MTLVLITCRPGNVERCIEEIGNVLYPYDQSIVFRETVFKGVVLLETRLDPMEAFRIIKSSEYGFVERVVPFLEAIAGADLEAIVSKAIELLYKHVSNTGSLDSICLRIRVRGLRGLSSRLYSMLKKELLEKGIRVDNRSGMCIYVESIGELFGIAVLGNREDRVH